MIDLCPSRQDTLRRTVHGEALNNVDATGPTAGATNRTDDPLPGGITTTVQPAITAAATTATTGAPRAVVPGTGRTVLSGLPGG